MLSLGNHNELCCKLRPLVGVTFEKTVLLFSLQYLVKCLSPNGKFADPTNEYGYISCTAGSAKRIPCNMGEKWEDETKSCERKGKIYCKVGQICGPIAALCAPSGINEDE